MHIRLNISDRIRTILNEGTLQDNAFVVIALHLLRNQVPYDRILNRYLASMSN